jgi:hypothetical protein
MRNDHRTKAPGGDRRLERVIWVNVVLLSTQ